MNNAIFKDRRIPLSLSISGFYIVSLLFFKWNVLHERTLYIYTSEFSLVIYASILLSLLLPLAVQFRKSLLPLLFLLKIILCWYCGYPLGDNIHIEVIITSVLVFELFLYGGKFGPWAALFLILFIYSEQKDVLVWNRPIAGPGNRDKILMIIALFSVYAFSLNIRMALKQQRADSHKVARLDKSVLRLTRANIDFQEHAIHAGRSAEESERKRLSREIHDIAGYTLTNIIMMTESATDFALVDPEKTRSLLEQSRILARKGLEEIRQYLRELRKVGQKYIVSNMQRLKELTTTFSQSTGIRIVLEFGNAPISFGPERDRIVYHMIQEGMVNAFRHGHCSEIRILFWCDGSQAKISVSDDGKGAQEAVMEGIGMKGMRERLEKVNGMLLAANTASGFELTILFPWEMGE